MNIQRKKTLLTTSETTNSRGKSAVLPWSDFDLAPVI